MRRISSALAFCVTASSASLLTVLPTPVPVAAESSAQLPESDAGAIIAAARMRARERAERIHATPAPLVRDDRGIDTEVELRGAWPDPRRTRIHLPGDIFLRNCHIGDPIRESPYPMTVD